MLGAWPVQMGACLSSEMKQVFETNPDLVESLSHIIAERRQGLAASEDFSAADTDQSAGILKSIKRFFGLK